ncbi:MAG: OB-fold nucleic acid binding domain-containing protein [Candidatus Limnocylindria bacterium]
MIRTQTRDLSSHPGASVLLRGWLQHRRALANVTFLILRDGSGTAQIALSPEAAAATADLTAEAAIEVVGRAVADDRASGGEKRAKRDMWR